MSTPTPNAENTSDAASESPRGWQKVNPGGDLNTDSTPEGTPIQNPRLNPLAPVAMDVRASKVDADNFKKKFEDLLKAYELMAIELKKEQGVSKAATDLNHMLKKDLDDEKHRHIITKRKLDDIEKDTKGQQEINVMLNAPAHQNAPAIPNIKLEVQRAVSEAEEELRRKQNYRA